MVNGKSSKISHFKAKIPLSRNFKIIKIKRQLSAFFGPPHPNNQDLARQKYRRISARDNPENQRQSKIFQARAGEKIDREHRQKRGHRSIYLAAQCLVYGPVGNLGEIRLMVAQQVFADAIVNHNDIIDRVADHRQKRGDDRDRDLDAVISPQNREHPQRHQHVMAQYQERRDAILPGADRPRNIFKSHRDVNKHRQQ